VDKLVIWGNEYLLTARIDAHDLNSRVNTNRPHVINAKNTNPSRRKRAREARDALERSTTTTTTNSERGTPTVNGNGNVNGVSHVHASGLGLIGEEGEMVKVHGGESFRSIIGVGWLGAGELVVVEKPLSDFVGELPPAFVSASYGRS